MHDKYSFRYFYIVVIISCLFSLSADGKGFGGGRGGGGRGGSFGGSKGGGMFGGAKGPGTFGGPSNYGRANNYGGYNAMNKPSSFKSNAMSFGAGALGGIAAYSLMRSMAPTYRPGHYVYEPGYGYGETCTNNEDLNGTQFGQFRCPFNGFPYEAKHCCGEYGKQYCCIREASRSYMRSSTSVIWIVLLIIIILVVVFVLVRRRQQRLKDVIMVPTDPPIDEQRMPPFYNPPPPPMGYPPPPTGNPYGGPPQNYDGSFNPYAQQYPPQQQMPYPPQQQMPYPPQQQGPYPQQPYMPNQPQQQSYNPYMVKEGGPPAYDDAINNKQGFSTTKPI